MMEGVGSAWECMDRGVKAGNRASPAEVISIEPNVKNWASVAMC
jgi:hypothetical protein